MAPDHEGITIRWRFVCQKRNSITYLHFLDISPDDTGPIVMSKLRHEYSRAKSHCPYNVWDRLSIFRKLTVEEAILSENSTTDLESQQEPRRVVISSRRIDPELTTAINDPMVLSAAEGFVGRNSRFLVDSTCSIGEAGRGAILINESFSKCGIWFLVLGGATLCLSAGISVGLLTKNFDVGVAVTSALAAVVACVEAVVFWMYR